MDARYMEASMASVCLWINQGGGILWGLSCKQGGTDTAQSEIVGGWRESFPNIPPLALLHNMELIPEDKIFVPN